MWYVYVMVDRSILLGSEGQSYGNSINAALGREALSFSNLKKAFKRIVDAAAVCLRSHDLSLSRSLALSAAN
jgi:hypothetical protein